MFRTEKAYKNLTGKAFWFLFVVFWFVTISTSVFVYNISKEIQDSLLSIMSITFPLIAGFLTFGRDTLKSLNLKINKINIDDESDVGDPVTDTDKAKIKQLKLLSGQFVSIVISTFFISFMLIIILLIAKFNDFTFTSDNKIESLYDFLSSNWFALVGKIIFFYLVYIMFLNTLFLTIFVIKVTQNDDLIDQVKN